MTEAETKLTLVAGGTSLDSNTGAQGYNGAAVGVDKLELVTVYHAGAPGLFTAAASSLAAFAATGYCCGILV